MANRRWNPATIAGKTRGDKPLAPPVIRTYTPKQIAKNNERWRKLEFAKGNPDWETTTHPSHCYDERGPLKMEKK